MPHSFDSLIPGLQARKLHGAQLPHRQRIARALAPDADGEAALASAAGRRYVNVMRGTPGLVQLLLDHFGLPALSQQPGHPRCLTPFAAAAAP